MTRETDINLPIGMRNDNLPDKNKIADIKAFIINENAKRSDDQKLETELLAVKLQMQDYLENKNLKASELQSVDNFLNLHLKVLNLSFKKFARSIETTDSNLKKYLSGDRKFNMDLAMKFGHFFHNGPHLWIDVQLKNDMLLYAKKRHAFKKYDYRKVVKSGNRSKTKVAL